LKVAPAVPHWPTFCSISNHSAARCLLNAQPGVDNCLGPTVVGEGSMPSSNVIYLQKWHEKASPVSESSNYFEPRNSYASTRETLD
jgi:hypothetical protein